MGAINYYSKTILDFYHHLLLSFKGSLKIAFTFSFFNSLLFFISLYIIPVSLLEFMQILYLILSYIFTGSIIENLKSKNNSNLINDILFGRSYWLKIFIVFPIPLFLLLAGYDLIIALGLLISFPLIYVPYFLILGQVPLKEAIDRSLSSFKNTSLTDKIFYLIMFFVLVFGFYSIKYALFNLYVPSNLLSLFNFVIIFFFYFIYYFLIALFINFVVRKINILANDYIKIH